MRVEFKAGVNEMQRKLIRIRGNIYHIAEGKRVEGPHDNLSGNVCDIRGNVSDIRGDVTGISGNVSGLRGNVSGIFGDVDDCNITDAERQEGINIRDLITN